MGLIRSTCTALPWAVTHGEREHHLRAPLAHQTLGGGHRRGEPDAVEVRDDVTHRRVAAKFEFESKV